MKKLILFMLIYFLYFYQVDANWYGTTDGTNKAIPISYDSVGSATTECPDDGDTTGGYAPSYNKDHAVTNSVTNLNPNPVLNTYSLNSNLTNAIPKPSSGTMYCLKWDGQNPVNPTTLTLSNVKNSDGSSCNYIGDTYYCKKSSINMNYNWTNGTDQGGSGIKSNGYQYVFQRVSDQYWVQDGYGSSGKYVSVSGLTQGTYVTWIRSFDNAGNANPNFTRGPYIVIDTTPPTLTDVTNSMHTNVLATNSRAYSLTVGDNGGSPVNIIEGNSENKDNQIIFDSRNITTRNLNSATLSFPWDISKVDNYRIANGGREYTFTLTRICDAAGNCPSFNQSYNHNVFANTTNITTKSVIQELSHDNIADGTTKNLVITLKDGYQNAIVPASGINRKVNIKYEYDNTMYLNQFSKTGNSVYNSKSNILNPSDINQYLNYFGTGTSKIKEFNNEHSTDGTYKYGFKFYTPTASSIQRKKSDTNAKFDIHNIKFKVTGDIGAIGDTLVDNSTNIKAKFKPLYQTEITGEIDENGFIAGNPQKSTLKINNDGGRINDTSLNNIYFKFGGNSTTLQKYNLNIKGGNFSSYTQIPESGYSTSFGFSNNSDFLTILDLEHAPAPATISANLTTHIAYKIDGKDVVYNSDKVGQDTYGNDVVTQQANQVGLKVIGTTFSKATIQDVVEDQNIQSIGKFDKSSTKLSIIKNAYAFAKNVNPSSYDYINSIDNPGSGYTQIGDIIYFGNYSGKLYRLGDGSNINVSTKKTILVIGGNLYIKSNIDYSGNGMLGIVVLKDNDGNGGNVYIDPGVKNISANIFAEKSLISYNGTTELDGSTPAYDLKNQLHIYGSVFSYNTIGGSAKTTPQCPYYVTNCSTKQIAQKYDLNYLRRYYLKTNSFGNLEPAYGGLHYYDSSNINYKYPVIIEYNPNIQKNPPPLFSD